jgi:hypothetical protein
MVPLWTFPLKVAIAGYTWVEGKTPEEAVLAPRGGTVLKHMREPGPGGSLAIGTWPVQQTRSLAPLETHSGLFRLFADLAPTRACIQAFANAYGPLWDEESQKGTLRSSGGRHPQYKHWVFHILLLRGAITLWELWRRQDTEGLATYVHWDEGSDVRIDTHPDCKPTSVRDSLLGDFPDGTEDELRWAVGEDSHLHHDAHGGPPQLHILKYFDSNEDAPPFSAGDLSMPACAYLGTLVETVLTTTWTYRMIVARTTGALAQRFEPPALLDALWQQFAVAITEGKTYQQCPACSKWFELSPSLNRADKRFCSDACRTRAYRQRLAYARDGSAAT